MKLYEIDIGSLWWFAADDEFEAAELMREEIVNMEMSDAELDDAMEDMIVREIDHDEAAAISVVDEYGSSMSSLWAMFKVCHEPQLITSDFNLEDLEGEEF